MTIADWRLTNRPLVAPQHLSCQSSTVNRHSSLHDPTVRANHHSSLDIRHCTVSIAIAIPSPPLTQRVASPRRARRRCSSKERDEDARAGAADRVTERDCSAIYIEACGTASGDLRVPRGTCGANASFNSTRSKSSSVSPGRTEQLAHGRHWSDAHPRRVHADRRPSHHTGHGSKPVYLHGVRAGHDDRRAAIGDSGGRSGRDDSRLAFDVGNTSGRRASASSVVPGRGCSSTVQRRRPLPGCHGDGSKLRVEVPRLDGRLRAPLTHLPCTRPIARA